MGVGPLEVSEKFLGRWWLVVSWIIESLCLPTEAFRDLSVTFTVLVKVKETGVSRETGCDNWQLNDK